MGKLFFSILLGLLLGFGIGYYFVEFSPIYTRISNNITFLNNKIPWEGLQNTIDSILFHKSNYNSQRVIVGFLPYWLLNKAQNDYGKYITDLAYFGVSVGTNGAVLRSTDGQNNEPGWSALQSGKVNSFLSSAQKNKLQRSLVVFSGNQNAITTLVENPIPHARNLVDSVLPLMRRYGFSDLNLDIEYTQAASDAARTHFVQFVKAVKEGITKKQKTTITVEISAIDVVAKHLIDAGAVGRLVDHLVIMAYDYHSTDSLVTGPIAPLYGAGTVSEYDVATAVDKTIDKVPSQKLILGIPLYGYEWETIGTVPRSAIIPNTGQAASNRRVELLKESCATCSAQFENIAEEPYLIYLDNETNSYHQFFYPDIRSTQVKLNYAAKMNLGGVALWALGYEGKNIMNPLSVYKNDSISY